MPASENLKKAVLYAKAECGLKPQFQAMKDEEIIYYLDHMADTDGESNNDNEIQSKRTNDDQPRNESDNRI